MRVVEEALDGVFGEQCLQLGLWGDNRTFMRFARTQRCLSIAEIAAVAGPRPIGQLHRLPVESDSIDVVLMPHTLDYSDRPHAILREVDRVLRRDGRLVVLGFKPGGLWGLRRLIPGAGHAAGRGPPDLGSASQRLAAAARHAYPGLTALFLPLAAAGQQGSRVDLWERRGQAWWPELAACYMLTAQKRVSTLTPVRPPWRRKPKVVGGLAEPSTRVSRIRFDENPR